MFVQCRAPDSESNPLFSLSARGPLKCEWIFQIPAQLSVRREDKSLGWGYSTTNPVGKQTALAAHSNQTMQ